MLIVEAEIKIPLKGYFSFSDAKIRFTQILGSPREEVIQRDTYFMSPVQNFWLTDEAFRLREVQGESNHTKSEITYKGPKLGQSMKIREEISVSISNAEDMRYILKQLGFSSYITIQKKRINWVVEGLVVSLDHFDNLGSFLEIEFSSEGDEVNKGVKNLIFSKVQELIPSWAGEEERRSYLELIVKGRE